MIRNNYMSEAALAQNLVNEILKLPEEKIIEVQNFINYLNSERKSKDTHVGTPGLSIKEAFTLRNKLSTFIEDWESKDMDIYDGL
jgi:hypothetical protein